MPDDEEFTFEVSGTGTGTMSCSFSEYDFASNTEFITENYYEIPVDDSTEITVTLSEYDVEAEEINVVVEENNVEIQSSETIIGEETQTYIVTVETDSDIGVAIGGGEYIKGEYAKVTAYEKEVDSFIGWYVDEELVSEDTEYRFMVIDSVTVTGKFKPHTHTIKDTVVPPTETELGYTEHKCEVCDYSYKDNYVEKTESEKPVTVVSSVVIRTPSTATISYGDSIILHADVENIPEGGYVKWTASNGNFTYAVSSDGTICTISPSSSGDTTFTATVYDANGNEISSDEQTMTSKAGFFDKIIAFFKKLFGLTKTIPQIYKGIF